MPTTSLTFTDQQLTHTQMLRVKKLRSLIDRATPFVEDLEKLGKEEAEGGERMLISVKTNRHSQTTQLSSGYEPINLSAAPLGTPAHEAWGDWIRPIIVSGHDERINRGSSKVLSIVEERTEDTWNGLQLEFNQALLRGDVAAMSDLLSVNGSDNSDGFFEHSAYGSQTNVVHNLSKATYATLIGWNNQASDLSNSFSANGLTSLYSIMTTIESLFGAGVFDKLRWYFSVAGANNLKRALNTQERYLSEKELDGGRRVMTFGGIPIKVLRDLPSTGTVTTSNPWTALLLNWNETKFVAQKGFYFKATGFETQPGFNVRASYIHLMGQLRNTYMATTAVVHRGETW